MPSLDTLADSPVTPESSPIAARLHALERLLGMLAPVPSEWLTGQKSPQRERAKSNGMACLPCTSYQDLVTAWRKALKWTYGLDLSLIHI